VKTLSTEGFSFVNLAEPFTFEFENVGHGRPAIIDNRPIMAEQRPLFKILPTGWDHPGWDGVFYPDDLPPEWRLNYFANEFSGVLVPQAMWSGLDRQRMGAWRPEVNEGFRFYLELNQAVDIATRDQVAGCLEGNFGGFLVGYQGSLPSAAPAESQNTGSNQDTLLLKGLTVHDMPRSWLNETRVACLLPMSELPDLAGQRRLLEQIADRVAPGSEVFLFLAGKPPALDKLRDLITLAQLLGFA